MTGWTGRARWLAVAAVVLAPLRGAATPTDGGAEPSTSLRALVGVVHHQTSDELVRGLRWSGPGPELLLGFLREDGGGAHRAHLRVPFAFLDNRYGHGALAWDVALAYGYTRRIAEVAGVDVALGGRYRWNWAVQYYEDFDEEHLYWMNAHEVGPLLAGDWRSGAKGRWHAELDVPLVAVVSRPPERRTYKIDELTHFWFYLTKTHEDARITSLHQHIATHASVSYARAVGRSLSFEARYAVDVTREARPRPVWLLLHSLTLGVSLAL